MGWREAVKSIERITGELPDWLHVQEQVIPDVAPPPTPLEEAETLLQYAHGGGGQIDRHSATWMSLAQWCANQIIEAQAKLETVSGEYKTAELRARIRTCRDLLAVDQQRKFVAEDEGRDVP